MEVHTVLTGTEFNTIHSNKNFYKVLNDSLCHYDFTYTDGLNVDTLPFNPSQTCCSGGLYFCEEIYLPLYLCHYGSIYATVSIPNDALVYKEAQKYKTNKLILHNIQPISELPLWLDATFAKKSVQINGLALQFVKEQTKELCHLAVQSDGRALQFVKEQTAELCYLAVKRDSFALQYAKEQTEELCLLAVQQRYGGGALQFVKEQTEEMCRLAVQQNGYALYYVKKQTEELSKLAVQQNGLALEYVKEQTEELCRLAVQQNDDASKYVKKLFIRNLHM